jgi:hypothetical protein
MSDITLQEGQMLLEAWHVEFKGVSRRRPPEEWVECRVVRMYHGTIYGGATGVGKTVEEARLEAVLGLARAITDDVTAFDHDADEIFKGEQYRWWLSRIQEERGILDEDYEEKERPRINKRAERRIKLLEEQMAIWQEEHDYWPEEESDTQEARREARAAQIRTDTAKRRAASARLADVAGRARSVGGTVAS